MSFNFNSFLGDVSEGVTTVISTVTKPIGDLLHSAGSALGGLTTPLLIGAGIVLVIMLVK